MTSSPGSSIDFSTTLIAPAAPTVALTSDTGSDNGDLITKVGTLSVTGTEAGAVIEYWKSVPVGAGGCPSAPAGFWRFCAWMAALTSLAVIPSWAMRSGLTQTRMEYCEPKTSTSPTPGTRARTFSKFDSA